MRIEVSGFLISCATRRATSRNARSRSASSSRSRAAASAAASSRSAWRSDSNSGAPRSGAPAGSGSRWRIKRVQPTSSSIGRESWRDRWPASRTDAKITSAPSTSTTIAKPSVMNRRYASARRASETELETCSRWWRRAARAAGDRCSVSTRCSNVRVDATTCSSEALDPAAGASARTEIAHPITASVVGTAVSATRITKIRCRKASAILMLAI